MLKPLVTTLEIIFCVCCGSAPRIRVWQHMLWAISCLTLSPRRPFLIRCVGGEKEEKKKRKKKVDEKVEENIMSDSTVFCRSSEGGIQCLELQGIDRNSRWGILETVWLRTWAEWDGFGGRPPVCVKVEATCFLDETTIERDDCKERGRGWVWIAKYPLSRTQHY